MRIDFTDPNHPPSRVRCGRAQIVGLGLDDNDDHIRYTIGDAYELYGGSQASHDEMQYRVSRILDEAAKSGISLNHMTYEQYQTLQNIIERINSE